MENPPADVASRCVNPMLNSFQRILFTVALMMILASCQSTTTGEKDDAAAPAPGDKPQAETAAVSLSFLLSMDFN